MKKQLKRLFVLVIAGAIVALIAGSSFAENLDAQGFKARHKARARIMDSLNLTPQQKEQVKKERSENSQAWKDIRQKMRVKRLELKEELDKAEVNTAKINTLTQEIKALMGEQFDLHVRNVLAMKKILTTEQFKKLQDKEFKKGPPENAPAE